MDRIFIIQAIPKVKVAQASPSLPHLKINLHPPLTNFIHLLLIIHLLIINLLITPLIMILIMTLLIIIMLNLRLLTLMFYLIISSLSLMKVLFLHHHLFLPYIFLLLFWHVLYVMLVGQY